MREKHDMLVKEATERLKKRGITKITYEVTLPNGGKVDVLAFDDENKVAVECMVQVQPKWVESKIKSYRSDVDKLIFLAPRSEIHKFKDIIGIDEIWKSETVVLPKRNILFKKVPDELYYQVLELKAKLNCETWIDFLEAIVEEVKK